MKISYFFKGYLLHLENKALKKALRAYYRYKGCPHCQLRTSIIFYGTYKRRRVQRVRKGASLKMQIQRLLCKNCKHTFSYLPPFLMRYKQFMLTVLRRPFERLMLGYRLNAALQLDEVSKSTFRRYLAWYEQHADRIRQIMMAIDDRLYKILANVQVPIIGANKWTEGSAVQQIWVLSKSIQNWLCELGNPGVSRLTLMQFLFRNNLNFETPT
jgi:transposase-like protein